MPDDLARLDATGQARLVRDGSVSPRELVDAAIARLARIDPQIGSVIHPALERARAAAAGPLPNGPFRGVPTLMKDIGGAEAGAPYCAGMRLLRDAGWTAREDGYFTRRLKAAGMVSLGRTNTPELALLPTTEPAAFAPTRNPWRPTHSAGGSSGGAAAAVAAGIVPVAHASDGGGSIRIPASHCGLVGLKPTRGRCSFGPEIGERWNGFSCEFMLTRSVRDAAALLDVVAGPWPGDPYFAPPPAVPFARALDGGGPRLRVGVLREGLRGIELHGECRAAVDDTARALGSLGHHVEEGHPEALDDPASVFAYIDIVATNTARALDVRAADLGREVTADDVEPLTWMLAERGRATTAPALLGAIEYAHGFGRHLAAWWERGFDLLLSPAVGAPAPELGYITSPPDDPMRGFLRAAPFGVFTLPFNMSGQPAISLPLHMSADGLPVGTQLVAPYGREDLLLAVAAELEASHPWDARHPPIHA